MVVEFYRYFGVRLGANFLEPRARPAPRAHAGAGLCPNAFTSTHPGTREARWSLAETGRAPAAHILYAARVRLRGASRGSRRETTAARVGRFCTHVARSGIDHRGLDATIDKRCTTGRLHRHLYHSLSAPRHDGPPRDRMRIQQPPRPSGTPPRARASLSRPALWYMTHSCT